MNRTSHPIAMPPQPLFVPSELWTLPIVEELRHIRKLLERDEPAPQVTPEPPMQLKVDEVAKKLALSKSRVYELCATGEIRSLRSGRSIRIPVGEMERWQKMMLRQR